MASNHCVYRRIVMRKNIGLIGHSEGGEIAPIMADRDRHMAFVVSLGVPGLPDKQFVPEQTKLIAAANGATKAEQAAAFKQETAIVNAASKPAVNAATAALNHEFKNSICQRNEPISAYQ